MCRIGDFRKLSKHSICCNIESAMYQAFVRIYLSVFLCFWLCRTEYHYCGFMQQVSFGDMIACDNEKVCAYIHPIRMQRLGSSCCLPSTLTPKNVFVVVYCL